MQLNGGATLGNGLLTLTDGNNGEARSAFTSLPVAITNAAGFRASFVYTDVGGGGADGATFCIQNTSNTAVGGNGGALAWLGINNTGAVALNVYAGNGGSGTSFLFSYPGGTNNPQPNGGSAYLSTAPVNIASGNPILVNLTYNGQAGTLSETLTDQSTGATYNTVFSAPAVNFESLLGGQSGYVGFTGATGGQALTQTISNFSFVSSGATGTPAYANAVAVAAGAAPS